MKLDVDYNYEEKKLIYAPIYILQGEPGCSEMYSDEKSIDEYLNKYGLTRQEVKEYQEYAIYNVIVKSWTKVYPLKKHKCMNNTSSLRYFPL